MTNHALKFGSVCSGIEAASVAWHPLGWKTAWVSEIDPFASAVLAHHYSDVPNLGDMTQLPQRILSGEVEAPEVFCGGTPCQAFSVAGLRQSLKDDRGNLSLTFVDIANAIDTVRVERGDLPAIIFWENVPGVLSTKDNAFGCFLAGLAGEDVPLEPPRGKWTDAGAVLGPKRTVAWRILDAQYFGLAQRRRRVFVVASARGGFDPTAILFESEGLRRDSAPSREAREGVARGAASGAGVSQPYTVGNTLTARMHKGINTTLDEGQTPVLAQPGSGWKGDFESETFITHSLRGEGFDASEDGTGRGTPLVPVHRDLAPTLTSNYGKQPDSSDTNAGPMLISMAVPDVAGTMKAGDPCHPLAAGAHALAVAYDDPRRYNGSHGGFEHGDLHPTLESTNPKQICMTTSMQVRRLTPVECERLQGFPDNYTAIPWRNKPASECPDGPRYKALGNSWAVPCVRWIGERIDAELKNEHD